MNIVGIHTSSKYNLLLFSNRRKKPLSAVANISSPYLYRIKRAFKRTKIATVKNKHIILKTDNKILFQSGLESLSSYWYTFDVVSLDLHNDERNIKNVMTDFEMQYYKEHRQIYYLDASFKN